MCRFNVKSSSPASWPGAGHLSGMEDLGQHGPLLSVGKESPWQYPGLGSARTLLLSRPLAPEASVE